MSWLLDADVLSQPAKSPGDPAVIAWLEREQEECYTSVVVIARIAYWVRSKQGRSRDRLQRWLSRSIEALEGRILSINLGVPMFGRTRDCFSIKRVSPCRSKPAASPPRPGATIGPSSQATTVISGVRA